MRRVLGLVGATLLFAGPALGADVGNPASSYKAPALAPVFSWTGWYIGANAGFGSGQSTDPNISSNFCNTASCGPMTDGTVRFPSLSPRGFIGGGQIGYDWQASPNWVFGLVADFQGAHISDSGATVFGLRSSTVTESMASSGSDTCDAPVAGSTKTPAPSCVVA